jgi:tRNA A-37 threonylcarbamoyl transferase component Bud32
VSRLRIAVREWRDAPPRDLTVDVPAVLMKDEPGTIVFPWAVGETRLVLKVYRRWNLVHWLRKRLTGFRVRREFRALALLHEAGLPCVDPVFWGIGWAPDHGRFEVLATREVPAAHCLSDTLTDQAPAARRDVLGRLFESFARLHQSGVYHGAPFLANVLESSVDGAPPTICLLDFEKSVCFGRDIRGTRMATFDLLNLVRSARGRAGKKDTREALSHYGLDEAGIARIFAAADAYRSSKFQRYRRRVEFLVRGALTRRRPVAGGPSQQASDADVAERGYCP